MLDTLPHDYEGFSALGWPQIEAFCNELQNHPLSADNVADWLKRWSKLAELVDETSTRNYVATTVDTTDEAAEKRYLDYLENVTPQREEHRELAHHLRQTLRELK